ncbi:hypothetical protein [Methylobacterium soli]|uniref:hypothetical protein n=1 Tax=Methylobacterium soli TaxID=553447 RepID=UPI001EE3733F|nr:hypothetical protein [Methylobacterium soli]
MIKAAPRAYNAVWSMPTPPDAHSATYADFADVSARRNRMGELISASAIQFGAIVTMPSLVATVRTSDAHSEVLFIRWK